MHPGLGEGALETADRGEVAIGGMVAELESDQPGTPGWMLFLELAGNGQELLS
jgi:hypothetical protein